MKVPRSVVEILKEAPFFSWPAASLCGNALFHTAPAPYPLSRGAFFRNGFRSHGRVRPHQVLINPAQGGDCGGRQKSARFLLNYWRVLFQLMLSLWAWISMGNSTVSRSRVQAFFFATPPFVLPAPFAPKKRGRSNVLQDSYLENWNLF